MSWRVLVLLLPFFAMACSSTNCREQKEKDGVVAAPVSKEIDPMAKTSVADRVKVFKADGSLQCGQGKAVPVAEMQKELKGIEVFSAINKNDGMMRIQVCGAPTGNSNVYEIHRKDLPAALKAGFKEWTAE